MSAEMRIGVDVGGTNTDAVLIGVGGELLHKAKRPTTADIASGIRAAIQTLVRASGGLAREARWVMVGSTAATNAVIERRGLDRVAVLRLGGPSTTVVRPLFDWPADLRAAIVTGAEIVRGGAEYDGRPIVPLDVDAVRRFAAEHAGDAAAIAICGVFANVADEQEQQAADAVRSEVGDALRVGLSSDIASIGLLDRESATVLNAALAPVARALARAVERALAELELDANLLFTQNDGTLSSAAELEQRPILTVGSGPANSIRGAAVLSGLDHALVIDVGGTSSDVGAVRNGFPRETSSPVEIGGVRTNASMPDVLAIALGGGTIVHGRDADPQLGPASVGASLTERALVFGGTTPTMTDAAVVAGRLRLGGLDPEFGVLLTNALTRSDALIADLVDRMRLSAEPVPLVAVGGGSHLVPDTLPGVSEVIRPQHHDVANAYGAGIASVAGEVDHVFTLDHRGRAAAVEEATDAAIGRAVAAGAQPDKVEVVLREETALAYVATPMLRVRVKAAGPLQATEAA